MRTFSVSRNVLKKSWLTTLVVSILSLHNQASQAQLGAKDAFGISLGAAPKYGPDFNITWANKSAPKGGKIVFGEIGTFDSLNPYALKNSAPMFLDNIGFRWDFVFEGLASEGMDESFARYGLLAKSMDVASDGLSMDFHLNPKAKFSDGKPVTADDVIFSFQILTSDKAPPGTKAYYADVKSVKAISKSSVHFEFKVKNRELPLILSELPILPKHVYGTGKDFIKAFARVKPVGSGPYVVKSFDFGKQITFERNKNWWAKDEAYAKGKWNFDEVQIKYYKDPNASMEAFKAGDYDIRFENSSRAWAVDHTGEKWDLGWIQKEWWKHDRGTGAQGFAFNMRRPLFKDRLVRKALAIALDFDWTNETLFYKQYMAQDSFFTNSEFNAKGLPDASELALLSPLKDKLPPEVFTEPKTALGKGLSGKQRLGEALKLLNQAGWQIKDGKLVDKNGIQMSFNILLTSDTMQRVVDPYIHSLVKIGINATVKIEDTANYVKRIEKHDFDMTSIIIGQSDSPGNEQRDYFHSSSADASESRNYSGIADPAIDALVDNVIKAETREALVVATKALDRALWFLYPMVPNWYLDADRISYWSRIGMPKVRPSHYSKFHFILWYGWYDQSKAEALQKAMASKSKLNL